MNRNVIKLGEHHHIWEGNRTTITSKPLNGISSKLVIDKEAYVVYLNNEKISFPKKEFELLLLLAVKPGKVIKRTEILQLIWGPEYKPKDSRSLDVHIRMVRKKLNNLFVSTVRGVGYRLEK